MHRHCGFVIVVLLALGALVHAGNAHFVGIPSFNVFGSTATVTGKVAGLGNVPQIHVVLSGDAACVNRGSNKPQAENKEAFAAEGDFPVQNGKALFQLAVEATFTPDCAPPMTVEWSNLAVTVTADDGTFLHFP